MIHYENEIDGWFDPAFATVYREAVAAAKDGDVLVELGCWKGRSLSFLLVEALNSGKKLNVYGVDHFKGNAENPAMQHEAASIDLHKVCTENAGRAGYPFSIWKKSSPEAAGEFSDGALSFVFIDASHDQASVHADITAWLPKVKPGGVLAGHDFGYSGVASAVIDLLPGFAIKGSCWVYTVPETRIEFSGEVFTTTDEPLGTRKVEVKEPITFTQFDPAPEDLQKSKPLVTPRKSKRGK